jgi:hypothetical protein
VEIFPSQGALPVSTTPVANCHRFQRHRRQICHQYQRHRRQIFATCSPCVVDTGGKFATGVNDTGSKFAAGVNDAGGILPPVSNIGNNIRLQTPEREHEGKNLYICFFYYPTVTKQNYQNFSD